MPLGTEVGLGPDDIVLDGDLATTSPKRERSPPSQFSAYVCCGKTTGWIKMALGMEVYLGAGHIVLDGVPASAKGTAAPLFSAHVYCGHGRPSQLLLSSCNSCLIL